MHRPLVSLYLVRVNRVALDDVKVGRVEDQLNGGHVTHSQRHVKHRLALRCLQRTRTRTHRDRVGKQLLQQLSIRVISSSL